MRTRRRGELAGQPLTPREIECLAVAARSHHAYEVAVTLGLHPQTVKSHLGTAYAKLGVESLVEAFAKLGWLRVPDDPDIATLAAEALLRRLEGLRAEIADLETRLRTPGSPINADTPSELTGEFRDLVRDPHAPVDDRSSRDDPASSPLVAA